MMPAQQSKNAQKKAAKAQRKLEKKEMRANLQEKEDHVIDKHMMSDDPLQERYGDFALHQLGRKGTTWTQIRSLNHILDGREVVVRARLHAVQCHGKAAFLVLRQGLHSVQATMFVGDTVSLGMLKYVRGVTKESIVDVTGTVNKVDKDIERTTQKDVEISVHEIHVISRAQRGAFDVRDAMETHSDPRSISMNFRRAARWLHLRVPSNHALFRLQSCIGQLWRDFLLREGFVEIHTPKITPYPLSDSFRLDYFGREAWLSHTSRTYHQMAICGDFERVFEVSSRFSSIGGATAIHLSDFIGLDLEMEIKESYDEVLDVLENLFFYIFDNLKSRFSPELEAVRAQHPFEDLVYKRPSPRLKYWEGVKMLRDAGVGVKMYDGEHYLETSDERKLGALVKEQYGTDFYMLEKPPAKYCPPETMKHPEEDCANSFRLFMRGVEVCSGAQHVHDANLMMQRANESGDNIPESYLNMLKAGAPPHGGASVGLERFLLLFVHMSNIRDTSLFARCPHTLEP